MKGTEELLNETYCPDMANRVAVDLSDIVTSSLTFTMPSANDAYTDQSSILDVFSVKIDGTVKATFTAVRAGVENFSGTASEFLAANWLTWQPQIKEVLANQPEWLTYYIPVTDGACWVRFYYTDGTVSDYKICDFPFRCFSLNTMFSRLWNLDESGKDRYGVIDVVAKNIQGKVLTYVQRYVLRNKESLDQIYLCENSLGGLDTFRFNGDRKLVPEIEYTPLQFDGIYSAADPDINRKWSQNTGLLTDRESRWCWEIFRSTKVYHLNDGSIMPVVLDSSSIEKSDMARLSSFSFEYRYSEDKGLLRVERTDSLPDIVGIPGPDGEIFFLEPRLVDYPEAVLSDTLLLLTQSPFEEKWYKLSIGSIRASILTSILETYGSMLHTHDNLSVLNMLSADGSGKLLFNGLPVGGGGEHVDTSDFVTLSTAQTVTGDKTFASDVIPGGQKADGTRGRLFLPSSLGTGAVDIFVDTENGIDGETPVSGAGGNAAWEVSTHRAHAVLNVSGERKELALYGHRHTVSEISGLLGTDGLILSSLLPSVQSPVTSVAGLKGDITVSALRDALTDTDHLFVTSAEKSLWTSKWTWNEEAVKAVKVDNAVNADKLGGVLASDYVRTAALEDFCEEYLMWGALPQDNGSIQVTNGLGQSRSVSLHGHHHAVSDVDTGDGWDALLKVAPTKYVTRWPTAAEVGAYTKAQVDTKLAAYLPLSGGTMTGAIRLAEGNTADLKGLTVSTGESVLLGYVGDDTYLAQQAGTTRIRSGATNLLHRRNGTDYAILDAYNYASYTYPTTVAKISDLHSSWDAVLKAQKPAWLTTVSLSTISDLHSSWDALLKAQKPTTLAGYGITNAYTQTEVNAKLAAYLPLAGGTMSGAIRYVSSGNRYLTLSESGLRWDFSDVTTGHAQGWLYVTEPDGSGYTGIGIYGTQDGLNYIYLGGSYAAPWIALRPSGNVGIGVTFPSYRLHVSGNAYVNGIVYAASSFNLASNGGRFVFDSSSDATWLQGMGDKRLCISGLNATKLPRLDLVSDDTYATGDFRVGGSLSSEKLFVPSSLGNEVFDIYVDTEVGVDGEVPVSGGGLDVDSLWTELSGSADGRVIAGSHIPLATSSSNGGIKIGYPESGKNYPVELDSSGRAYVNVPWVNTTYSLSSFGITATAAEINKLDGMTASKTELNYLDGVTSSIQTQLNNRVTLNTAQTISGLKTFARDASSVLYVENTAATSTSKYSAIVFQRAGSNIGIIAAGVDTNYLYRANPAFSTVYTILDTGNYTSALDSRYMRIGSSGYPTAYRKVFNLNGTAWSFLGTTTDAPTAYAPTTAGTSGYVLQSTGGTPKWAAQNTLVVKGIYERSLGVAAGDTMADLKSSLTTQMGSNLNKPGSMGFVTTTSVASIMSNWANDDYELVAGSRTNFLRLDGYGSSRYGVFLVSGYQGSFYRLLKNSSTAWGGPYLILDTGNYASTLDSRYVKKSGDTMTGRLTLGDSSRLDLVVGGTTRTAVYDDGDYTIFGDPDHKACVRGSRIIFQNAVGSKGLVMEGDTFTFKGNSIWHAGNDGSGSGLDADLLDGTHKSGLLTALSSNATTNLSLTVGGTVKSVADLYATYANQLLTSRTLWGQSFNGTGNVSGAMTGVGSITGATFSIAGSVGQMFLYNNTSKNDKRLTLYPQSNYAAIYNIAADGSTVSDLVLGNNTNALYYDASADRWGIGTTSPSYKLHVIGSGYFSSTLKTASELNANTVRISSTSATAHLAFSRANYNYMTAPSGGGIAFVTNGKEVSGDNTDMYVGDGRVSVGGSLSSEKLFVPSSLGNEVFDIHVDTEVGVDGETPVSVSFEPLWYGLVSSSGSASKMGGSATVSVTHSNTGYYVVKGVPSTACVIAVPALITPVTAVTQYRYSATVTRIGGGCTVNMFAASDARADYGFYLMII